MEKQVYSKGSRDIIEIHYDSLYDYIQYLDSARVTENFLSREQASHKISENTTEWTGTKNYEEARTLCLEGEYDSAFDDFDKERMALDKEIARQKRSSKVKRDLIGFSPIVPAYLMGIPKDMYNSHKSPRPAPKKVSIYYNVGATCGFTANQMRNKGICTLALVKELEKAGYAVELHICFVSTSSNQVLYSIWNLKKSGESIDYRSLYFPMVNPSFLRRLEFRLIEVTPELDSSWTNGYGRSEGVEFLRDFLEVSQKGIAIGLPSDHGIEGKNIASDYKSFLNSLTGQLERHIGAENLQGANIGGRDKAK